MFHTSVYALLIDIICHIILRQPLSIGIERILPIEGFEGMRELNANDLLVLILGFEGNRAISFLSQFSPYNVLPIISIPNEGENEIDNRFYDDVVLCNRNLLRKHRLIKDDNGEFYRVSSLNHIAFFNELNKIISRYKKSWVDICISPVGTKPQTLGLYMVWKANPEIQLIYSVPLRRIDMTLETSILDVKDSEEKEEQSYELEYWILFINS